MDDYSFSYAAPHDRWGKRWFVRLVEQTTGQPKLERLYRQNRSSPQVNESFWQACVRSLNVDVRFDSASLACVPKTGPVVVVANHPFGVLDGMISCWLIEKIRPDFMILIHSALLRAPEVRPFVLPIDFAQTADARTTNLATRAAARLQLERGGAVIIFPAGMISTSPDRFGQRPAVDARWQPFVAQLVQRSNASVVPIWFQGQNSRFFQIVSHISATFRLALIFHEVAARIGASLVVAIGEPIAFETLSSIKDRQDFVDRLYTMTYALGVSSNTSKRPEATKTFNQSEVSSLFEAGRSI